MSSRELIVSSSEFSPWLAPLLFLWDPILVTPDREYELPVTVVEYDCKETLSVSSNMELVRLLATSSSDVPTKSGRLRGKKNCLACSKDCLRKRACSCLPMSYVERKHWSPSRSCFRRWDRGVRNMCLKSWRMMNGFSSNCLYAVVVSSCRAANLF